MKKHKGVAQFEGRWWVSCLLAMALVTSGETQVQFWEIGSRGLTWDSQAEQQVGAVTVDGGLQPLQLIPEENLTRLLADFGRPWQNGAPPDFTQGGLPRTWSNSSFFDGIQGPLKLVDGNPQTSSENVFKGVGNPAGTAFFFDLGAIFPIDRVRFYPAPDDLDSYMRAFELFFNDGNNFDPSRRPYYTSLRRVENNRIPVVEIDFALLNVRFLQLRNLSRSTFNLAEFEIYGRGFIPAADYLSKMHRFDTPVNVGRLRVETTRLGDEAVRAGQEVVAYLQVRNGADDTPLNYFRRDRELGTEEEVSQAEYENQLPRLAFFRKDPLTGAVLGEVSRAAYLALPVDQQGPIRDFIQGNIRVDSENWSPWSALIRLDNTGIYEFPLDLPGPRQYLQFRVSFEGDDEHAMRLDHVSFEYSPLLASAAVGEIALAADPAPAAGFTAVPSGVDTTFILDVRTEFAGSGLEGFNGIRLAAFPPPVFESIEMGDPLSQVDDFEVKATERGFEVFFPAMGRDNNRPLRIGFRQQLLEHNTPVNVWLLGARGGLPQPVAAGNASREVTTSALNVFTIDYQPALRVSLSSPVLTPNGDGLNETIELTCILTHFTGVVQVDIEVFDLAGRRVRRLLSAPRSAGIYQAVWDGRNDHGELIPPGNYVCRIGAAAQARNFVTTKVIGVVY